MLQQPRVAMKCARNDHRQDVVKQPHQRKRKENESNVKVQQRRTVKCPCAFGDDRRKLIDSGEPIFKTRSIKSRKICLIADSFFDVNGTTDTDRSGDVGRFREIPVLASLDKNNRYS